MDFHIKSDNIPESPPLKWLQHLLLIKTHTQSNMVNKLKNKKEAKTRRRMAAAKD